MHSHQGAASQSNPGPCHSGPPWVSLGVGVCSLPPVSLGGWGVQCAQSGGWGKGITCLLAESCHLRPSARAQPAQTQLEETSLLPGRSHQLLTLNLRSFRSRSCWGCTSVLFSSHHIQLIAQPVSEHRALPSSLDTPCPAVRVHLMCQPAYTMGPRFGASTCLDVAMKVFLEEINIHIRRVWASLVAQLVMNPPAMQETSVQSLGRKDLLEKGKVTPSSILAWRIPWTV